VKTKQRIKKLTHEAIVSAIDILENSDYKEELIRFFLLDLFEGHGLMCVGFCQALFVISSPHSIFNDIA
jgi:hypothetical protein